MVAHLGLGEDRPNGKRHKDQNRCNFDEGKPEFGFAEGFYRQHVQAENEDQSDQSDHPTRDPCEEIPVVHVDADRRNISHHRHCPVKEEEPAGDEGAAPAKKFTCVRDEGSRGGAADCELTECSDHEEGENSANRVGESKKRTSLRKASACTEEEAGTNRSTDCNHLQVAVFEGLIVARVALIRGVSSASSFGVDRGLGSGLVSRHVYLPSGWSLAVGEKLMSGESTGSGGSIEIKQSKLSVKKPG